jgi:hypothetical protein
MHGLACADMKVLYALLVQLAATFVVLVAIARLWADAQRR